MMRWCDGVMMWWFDDDDMAMPKNNNEYIISYINSNSNSNINGHQNEIEFTVVSSISKFQW